ncbi:hypothetical protein [Chitinophaga sancti]|uniref:Uncharacterized protein n=1 Tax=Chitinophaga sancti TaxID=1004 RepID=A0A1K1NYV9_9BACT|nr:hypothetical protein [Chitinophaga sancti]WQD60316.1 hypothetical protein U0033_20705 [Chitinophaga sancti]WQG87556.1 hypothetical protein SR876_21765 [Chitinophaga sancti]SFW40508.1 hypothetical protein SAMN05661012_01615 [Chitinophaga sancti]
MESDELIDIDIADLNDMLSKIETSFHIKFTETDNKHVKTFGELCDVIVNKIEGNHVNDCTTQQAFYKVRKAIIATQHWEKNAVKPDTKLAKVFPRKHRRKLVKKFETALGYKTHLLEPKMWLSTFQILATLASMVTIFFSPLYGFTGLALCISSGWITIKLSKELNLVSVQQLVERVTREHYMTIRRNPCTVNRAEIIPQLKELFKADLSLDDHAVRADAPLF